MNFNRPILKTLSMTSVVFLCLFSSCNPTNPPQTVPAMGILINSQNPLAGGNPTDRVTVTTSPMVLTLAVDSKLGGGIAEFFDGSRSIGTLSSGVTQPPTPPSTASFVHYSLTINFTKADNGDHKYRATFTTNVPSGTPYTYDSATPITVTVNIP